MQTVQVELGDRSYPIFIGANLLENGALFLPFIGHGRAVVVTNDIVAPLYLEKVKSQLGTFFSSAIVLPDGENTKTIDTVARIYEHLLEGKYDRTTTLVALGGGVVGDIAGFAAATYLRGIKFLQMPTTLLAQVDSSVGGKTGVNHALGKNMIGAFYQPQCVVADTEVLRSLPKRQVKAGMAEVLKYGLIKNPKFFDWLAENNKELLALQTESIAYAVRICCQEKSAIVAKDEKEAGVRALLNLGHTFGHAIETATGYGNWLHGEAVAMGMVMAADLSMRLGWLSQEDAARIRLVLEKSFGMQVSPPADISVRQYLDLMSSDKKAELGKIRFILLKAIGQAEIFGDVENELLEATLTAGRGLCL